MSATIRFLGSPPDYRARRPKYSVRRGEVAARCFKYSRPRCRAFYPNLTRSCAVFRLYSPGEYFTKPLSRFSKWTLSAAIGCIEAREGRPPWIGRQRSGNHNFPAALIGVALDGIVLGRCAHITLLAGRSGCGASALTHSEDSQSRQDVQYWSMGLGDRGQWHSRYVWY